MDCTALVRSTANPSQQTLTVHMADSPLRYKDHLCELRAASALLFLPVSSTPPSLSTNEAADCVSLAVSASVALSVLVSDGAECILKTVLRQLCCWLVAVSDETGDGGSETLIPAGAANISYNGSPPRARLGLYGSVIDGD